MPSVDLGGAEVLELEKSEASSAVIPMSPPEGNTTFLGGTTTWCIALPSGVSQTDLQAALDWTCGLGMADCRPIREGGPCYLPDTLVSHASFAFNTYYQQNGNSDIACNFGGTATLTKTNPSIYINYTLHKFNSIYIYIMIYLQVMANVLIWHLG